VRYFWVMIFFQGKGRFTRALAALLSVAFCYGVTGCRKDPSLYMINNLNNGTVLVFGHGGMGRAHRLPMNSASSLLDCFSSGADGVEMDVRRAADGALVLYHDKDLKDASACGGRVEERNAQEITGCSYKKAGGKERIITLRALLDRQPEALWLALDCKTSDDAGTNARFADTLAALITQYGLAHRVMIESAHEGFLSRIASLSPASRVYLLTPHIDTALAAARRVPLDGISVDIDDVSAQGIERAHQAGLRVTLYNVATNSDNFRALSMSPDNVQTDRVRHMVRVYVSKREHD
jgi:glycerophosphoryl diester phosphodiesterase